MRFYLSSFGLGDKSDALRRAAQEEQQTRILVIANAQDFGENRAASVERQMRQLEELGFRAEELDLRCYFGKQQQLRERLREAGGVFVVGGNVFVLRQAMRLSGFDAELFQLPERFLYAGYSAGVCVLCGELEALSLVDNPEAGYPGAPTPLMGLGVFPYVFLPHYDSPSHPETQLIGRALEWCLQRSVPVCTLRDGDVVLHNWDTNVDVASLTSHPELRCSVINLDCSLDEIQEQKHTDSSVGEYLQYRAEYPRLYLQELYARDIPGLERTYPSLKWEERNLFLRGCRFGRCESFFWGNKGTYGPIHCDVPLGVALIKVLSGCKRVVMFPPDAQPLIEQHCGAHFRGSVSDVAFIGDLDAEIIEACNGTVYHLRKGDLLVIPRGWYHQIFNMEDDTLSWHDMVLQPEDIASFAREDEAGALKEIRAALLAKPRRSEYEEEALRQLESLNIA